MRTPARQGCWSQHGLAKLRVALTAFTACPAGRGGAVSLSVIDGGGGGIRRRDPGRRCWMKATGCRASRGRRLPRSPTEDTDRGEETSTVPTLNAHNGLLRRGSGRPTASPVEEGEYRAGRGYVPSLDG